MVGRPWLLPCYLLLSCLPSTRSSPCQEAVDTGGSVYGVEYQTGADSKTCQKDSFVFTMGGRRYCLTDQEAEGSVATNVRCNKGNPTSALPSTPHSALPSNATLVSQ